MKAYKEYQKFVKSLTDREKALVGLAVSRSVAASVVATIAIMWFIWILILDL